MADCECLAGCIFFNDKMDHMPAIADMYKKKYCQKNNDGCARYQVFKALGKGKVPDDLYPNQVDRVSEIVDK